MASLFFIFILLVPTFSFGGELHGDQILNTGAYICDSQIHTKEWIAPQTIQVTKAMTWTGVNLGVRADVLVYATAPNGLMIASGCDCYDSPSQPRQVYENFSPHHFTVNAGQAITLHYRCAPVGTQSRTSSRPTSPRAHHALNIWWVVP